MTNQNSAIYRKAFMNYLRRGTPIEIFLKAAVVEEERSTRYYVWRTVGDNKVRPSHEANDGGIFAWDNPPATGNPGDEDNCRCSAEPYTPKPGLDGVYPELLFLPGGVIVRRIGGEIIRRVLRRNEQRPVANTKPEPRLDDTNTWPTPPKQGRFKGRVPVTEQTENEGRKKPLRSRRRRMAICTAG